MSVSFNKLATCLALSATTVFSTLTFGAAQAQTLPMEGVPYTIERRHGPLFLDGLRRSQDEGAPISQWPRQVEDGVQQIWIFEHVAGMRRMCSRSKATIPSAI